MSATLERQVRTLIEQYGRDQVSKAVANAGAVEQPQQRTAVARPGPKTAPAGRRPKKPRRTPLEVVAAARVAPEVRPVLERIAVAYENRQILPELCGVRKFLAKEGLDPDRVRSRADALRKLVRVLSTRRCEELEELFEGWRKQVELGDLGLIAEAILGPAETTSPAGRRERSGGVARRPDPGAGGRG